MKRGKRGLALVLAIALGISTLLSGCSQAEAQEIADVLARAAGEAIGEYISSLEETGISERKDPELAKRFETEKPWVNSNVYMTVTPEYTPDLKDDFYVAVNKEWFDHPKFNPGYITASPFADQEYKLRNQVRQILTDPSIKGEDVEKVQSLYSLWMDWDARNSFDYVSEIRSHTDIVQKIRTMEELSAYLTSEESWHYGSNIAGAGLALDLMDSSRYSVDLTATGLTLSDAAEYETLTEEGYLDKEFADAVSRYMLQYIGYTKEDAEAIIAAKYDFEWKIAAYEMTYNEWNDPDAIEQTYHPVTLEELKELSPRFPYVELLETTGYAESEYISLEEPEWLAGLNELYTEENLQAIKAYLIDDIASSYMAYIDENSYRYLQQLQMKRYGGDSAAADEDQAYHFVQGRLSPEISRIYVENFVTQEKVEDIELLINEAVEYYEQMLREIDWLSEETREKAVEKLKGMGVRAVRPEKWIDRSGLKIGTKEEGETLISAIEKIAFFVEDYERSLLNTKVDPSYWMTESITEVNSYYYASLNEIYIIAGILGDKFYDENMTIEEKMGAIGSIIGHEISHAFDTNGAQFDKDGNVADWWTEEDYATFRERAGKLIDYFSTFTVDDSGNNYNGFLVQTETIADMAGLKCMLGIAKGIDGFDYDKFFRSYATMWRELLTEEYMATVIRTDTHALNYLRVNAVVQQFEEFYETYDIKEGDGMYLAPEDRVAVW